MSGDLPTDFGFVIDVHAHEPETVYVIPIKSDSEHYPPEGGCGSSAAAAGETSGSRSAVDCRHRTATSTCCDAMAVDSLDPCGVYFGTTGGQVYVSPDGGDNWTTIVHDLPRVLSVEVQTLR